jgi:NitT/TauT family transport system substrate-binding protein
MVKFPLRYLWLALVPIAVGCFFFVSQVPAASDPFKIVVTEVDTPLAPNSVIDLANRLGYYARQGVRVQLIHVQGTPIAVAALISGQGDMANIGVDTVLQLVGNRQIALKGVVSPNTALPYVIVAKTAIQSVKGLEGHVIGIGRIGSVDYLQMRNVMTRMGANVGAVTYLSIGQPAQRGQALAAGQIDATTMTIGSWIAMPNHKGLHVLVDQKSFAQAAPFITKLSVVTDKTDQTRGPEIAAVVRATMQASRDFAQHPELWANAMAKLHPEIPHDRLLKLAKAYRNDWSVDGGIEPADATYTAAELYKTKDFRSLPHKASVGEWIDMHFINDAMRTLGAFHRLADRSFVSAG